jgi:hypothetical protein
MDVCFGLHVSYRLQRMGFVSENFASTAVFILIFGALIGLRLWLGTVIGNAALRRGCGYMGWIICSLVVGPLFVWFVYLIFVHWRPKDFGIPYVGDADATDAPDTGQNI